MADINGEFGGFEIQEKKRPKMYFYRIFESELERIKKGSPSGILFSIGLSCIFALLSTVVCVILTPPPDDKAWISGVLTAMILVFLIGAVILLSLWYKNRKSVDEIINTIKGERKMDPQEYSYIDDDDFE